MQKRSGAAIHEATRREDAPFVATARAIVRRQTKARCLQDRRSTPAFAARSGFGDIFGGERELAHAFAGGGEERVGDGRRDQGGRGFADAAGFFGARHEQQSIAGVSFMRMTG